MAIPLIDFRQMKRSITVAEVLRYYGWVPTTREPASLRGPCPIHQSRSHRSRSLSVTRREWYCHVCRHGGDVIRLVQLLDGVSPVQAALRICDLLHITVPRR
jgi:DNA primase